MSQSAPKQALHVECTSFGTLPVYRGLPLLPPSAGNMPELGGPLEAILDGSTRLVPSDRPIMHGMKGGVGEMRSTWGIAPGETSLKAVGAPSDAPSILPLFTGKLTVDKRMFRVGRTTDCADHPTKSQRAGGHEQRPYSNRCRKSRKRGLLACSNPEHRRARGEQHGGMSFGGENTCETVG